MNWNENAHAGDAQTASVDGAPSVPDDGNAPHLSDAAMPPCENEPTPAIEGLRGRLLRQFEQWLDVMLAGEELPPAVPPELLDEARLATTAPDDPEALSADLYTLFSSLTTLSGEIRLQGRAFKQLSDALTPLGELPANLKQLDAAQRESARHLNRFVDQQINARSGESSLPPSKEVLAVLFDMLDRLARGMKTLDAAVESLGSRPSGGWLARLGGAGRQAQEAIAATRAISEGYSLTLSRLQAALQQWSIQRIGAVGEMFDPATMTVVQVQGGTDQPDGTVVELYRSGYVLHGQVLAPSQVKVAKR